MARIGMKISFRDGIPLKRALGSRRKFAVLIPAHCETVEEVKDFVLEEFCALKFSSFLELSIDSSFAIRDEESVDLIAFYSKMDKLFEFTPKSWGSSTSSPSFLRSNFMVDIDEVDSQTTSILNSPLPSPSPSSSSTRSSVKRKRDTHARERDDEDEDDVFGESPPVDSTGKSAASEKPVDTKVSVVIPNQEAPGEKITKSAKRRDRLRRSCYYKRLRATPEALEPIDETVENKENQSLENASTVEEAQVPSADNNFVVPNPRPPRSRILRSRTRKSTPRPPEPYLFESVFMKVQDENVVEGVDTTNGGESIYDPTYYGDLPSASTIEVQDVIAFQVWELNTGGPVLSKFCEARVVGKTEDTLTLEYLKGGPSNGSITTEVEVEGYAPDGSLGFQTEMSLRSMENTKKVLQGPSPPTVI